MLIVYCPSDIRCPGFLGNTGFGCWLPPCFFVSFGLGTYFNLLLGTGLLKNYGKCERWSFEDLFMCLYQEKRIIWTASSEFGTYRLCEQRSFRRACASAQSRQNLRCSLIQAVSQEEPSDRKPDPWPL